MNLEYSPQYTLVCPKCGNTGTFTRRRERVVGFLWWKKTYYAQDNGETICPKCKTSFYYETKLDNLQHCLSL